MEMKFKNEEEDFGQMNAWRLLSRGVVEEQRVTVRGLAVQGKGILIQTSRQYKTDDGTWSIPDFDSPILVEQVLMLEFMTVEPSAINGPDGQPVSLTRQISGRELVSVSMARDKFQPKTKGNKNGAGGPYAHLDIRAGVVLTMETAPQPAQKPSAPSPLA